jgi:hypothetical protein
MTRKDREIERLSLEIVNLERRVENLSSQDVSAYTKADREIRELSKKCLKGSALTLSIRHLSGNIALSPVSIIDGLGAATLECILQDIRESHSIKLAINPISSRGLFE